MHCMPHSHVSGYLLNFPTILDVYGLMSMELKQDGTLSEGVLESLITSLLQLYKQMIKVPFHRSRSWIISCQNCK